MCSVLLTPTPGPVDAGSGPGAADAATCDPICDRCGRAAGRTYRVTPTRRYCWPCLDRHLTNLPPKGDLP